MLNVNELEQRWKRYKIKSFIPYIIISISLIIIFIIIFLFVSKEEPVLKHNDASINPKIKETKTLNFKPSTKIQDVTDVQKQEDATKKKLTFTPSYNFVQNIQDEKETQTITKPISKKPVIIQEDRNIPTEILPEPTITPIQPLKVQEPEEKDNTINITRKTTKTDISEVIKRFNKSNNPALSLFIAKKYYELGEYRKSYNYALITNEINNDIESSWIIFAKSLVMLGEKDQAIETLQKYIKHSNSNRATALLDRIKSGKFK